MGIDLSYRQERPNPGSDEAIELGCTCPVMDNNHGKFPVMEADEEKGIPAAWYIHVECPIHASYNWGLGAD